MDKKDLLKLLDNVQEDGDDTVKDKRVLFIDGLNLFFRNFAMLNMVNPSGVHIGGLGGFFRSLGAMIRQIDPTEVYVIFDGAGSTASRKNIVPEYKSGRNTQRITNWEVFEDLNDEHDSKVDQIVRVIQYLKTLPVKTIIVDKVEADDIIAYLSSKVINQREDRSFIVSSDKDFLQLINENIVVYRPMEKKYYTKEIMEKKYKMPTKNFILYKTLLGDASDKVKGVKGLGEKGLLKKFPELSEGEMTWNDILNICENKFKDHVVYARVLQGVSDLEKNYKLMDLSNPMLDENDKNYLDKVVESKDLNYIPEQFMSLYKEDQLGGMIRNLDFWLKDVFQKLVLKK
jgi:5'-3' exonuclease